MRLDRWFKFSQVDLNKRLIDIVDQSSIPCYVDAESRVWYPSVAQFDFEEMLAAIRAEVFPAWQTLSCPVDWIDRYRDEMKRRRVKFKEEINNGKLKFLLARRHDPHSWALE